MIRSVLFAAVLALSPVVSSAQISKPVPPPLPESPQVFIQNAGPGSRMPGDNGLLGFERTRIDFASQSVGIENCANVPITNTTDNPRILTRLTSTDPAHYYVSSPSEAMLPMTVGANSTLFINICFKPNEVRAYHAAVVARFGDDSSIVVLDGKGVKAPAVKPIPTDTKIASITKNKHDWTIDIDLAVHAQIRLQIEDAMAHKLRTFPFEDTKVPGVYEVTFDGKDDLGKKLPKGTYYLRLEVVNRQTNSTIHDTKTIVVK